MTLNGNGSPPQKIFSDLTPVIDLAWSPDGQRLAFARTVQIGTQGKSIYGVFTINNDGSDIRQISPPSLSVSGIFYRPRHPDQVSAGLVLDPQKPQQAVAYLLADRAGPPEVKPLWGTNTIIRAWYPSGDKAIVESPVPDSSDFNVSVASVGGGLDLLGPNLWATTPSPDGTKLVFYKERSGVGGVYIADADGTNSHRILAAYPRTSYTRLRWTSDGHRLVMLHTGISDERMGMNDTIETILPDGNGWLHLATGINSVIAGGQIVACGGG
jgi:dipeptidyl aminopeptidase/acylaminoacyl peptidase